MGISREDGFKKHILNNHVEHSDDQVFELLEWEKHKEKATQNRTAIRTIKASEIDWPDPMVRKTQKAKKAPDVAIAMITNRTWPGTRR